MDLRQRDKYKKLALNINYYRKARGVTQYWLAAEVEISGKHMQQIEAAEAAASLDVVFRLSDALEVPVHKLFEFRD